MGALYDITLPGWAIRHTGQVAAWCPWCGDLHMHGEPGAVIGDVLDRGAHCTSDASPALGDGYNIRVVGIVDRVHEVEPARLAIEPGKTPLADRLTGRVSDGWGLRLPVLRGLFTNGRLSSNAMGGFTFTPHGLEVSVSPSGAWWVRQRQRAGWITLGQGKCVLALMEMLFAWPRGWAAVHILRACGAVLSPHIAARVAELIEQDGAAVGNAVPSLPFRLAASGTADAKRTAELKDGPIAAAVHSGISGDDVRCLGAFAQHLAPRVVAEASELGAENPATAELATACNRIADFLTADRAEHIAALLDAAATATERRA